MTKGFSSLLGSTTWNLERGVLLPATMKHNTPSTMVNDFLIIFCDCNVTLLLYGLSVFLSHCVSLTTVFVSVGRAISVDGILPLGVTTAGGFNEQKLKPPPSVAAQPLLVCIAQSASASVLALVLFLSVPMVVLRQIDQSMVELLSSLDRQSMAERFVCRVLIWRGKQIANPCPSLVHFLHSLNDHHFACQANKNRRSGVWVNGDMCWAFLPMPCRCVHWQLLFFPTQWLECNCLLHHFSCMFYLSICNEQVGILHKQFFYVCIH